RRRLGTCRFGFGAADMMIAAFDSGGVRQGALRGAEGACGFVPASSDGLFARAGVAQASQAHWPRELDDLLEGDKRPRALARGPGHDGQDAQLVLPATADPGVLAGAAEDLVSAFQIDRDQASLPVERLRAATLRVHYLERARRKHKRARWGAGVGNAARSEHAGRDDAARVGGPGRAHDPEMLRAGDGRPRG